MDDNIKEKEAVSAIKIFGMVLPSMPSLMIRLSGTFLRFKRRSNKAGKVFKKELIKQGVDKETAKGLTETYMEGSHIRNYIQNLR